MTTCESRDHLDATRLVLDGLSHIADANTAGRWWTREHGSCSHGWMRYSGELRSLGQVCVVYSTLETLEFSLPPLIPRLLTYQTINGLFYRDPTPLQELDAIESGRETPERFALRYGQPVPGDSHVVNPMTNAVAFRYLVRHENAPIALCNYLVQVAKEERLPAQHHQYWYQYAHAVGTAYDLVRHA